MRGHVYFTLDIYNKGFMTLPTRTGILCSTSSTRKRNGLSRTRSTLSPKAPARRTSSAPVAEAPSVPSLSTVTADLCTILLSPSPAPPSLAEDWTIFDNSAPAKQISRIPDIFSVIVSYIHIELLYCRYIERVMCYCVMYLDI